MGISEKHIKKLWGLAAGLCSHPECDTNCIQFLGNDDTTIIGEMAHVIAKSPKGPRGIQGGGTDDYSNLILLCPTHHRLIDKSPSDAFPESIINKWKNDHEDSVRLRLNAPIFNSKKELAQRILRLLIENHSTWKMYGPESDEAINNPISNVARFWVFRKISYVLPNNREIVNLIRQNSNIFTADEYRICVEFVEHAEGFESSTYNRKDSVPRFPIKFEEFIRHVTNE